MTAILGNDKPLGIPRGPLTATVDASGADPEDVLLTARSADGTSTFRSPRPTVVQLTAVNGSVELGVEPRGGGVFASGVTVTLTLRGGGTDVVLPDVDVAGRGPRKLVALDVQDERALSVTAVNPPGERPLPALAAAARSEARAQLGVDQTEQPVHLAVLVDLSTSMRAALADGRVSAIVDVVAGLSHVVGEGRELSAWLGLAEPVRVQATEARLLATATVEEAGRRRSGIGFRAACDRGLTPGPGITYVVTDGVPADVGDLTPGAHHLVLTDDGLSRSGSPGIRSSILPATGGQPVADHLVQAPGALTGLVRSMLASLPAAHPPVEEDH